MDIKDENFARLHNALTTTDILPMQRVWNVRIFIGVPGNYKSALSGNLIFDGFSPLEFGLRGFNWMDYEIESR